MDAAICAAGLSEKNLLPGAVIEFILVLIVRMSVKYLVQLTHKLDCFFFGNQGFPDLVCAEKIAGVCLFKSSESFFDDLSVKDSESVFFCKVLFIPLLSRQLIKKDLGLRGHLALSYAFYYLL